MELETLLSKPFSFTRRNQLIPCELRSEWKMALILDVFRLVARNNKCSLSKLHLANWITKSSEHLEDFLSWSKSPSQIRPEIRMEPALDRAIELMIAKSLLKKSNGKLELTTNGQNASEEIAKLEVNTQEREMLRACKSFMAETKVEQVFRII